MSLIQKHKVLYYQRNRYEKDQSSVIKCYADSGCLARRFSRTAEVYISELEYYLPNEIIDEYTYCETFRSVLSLVKETFRPDQFNSVITGELIHWLDFDFMEWVLLHQCELKRQLTWSQVCELQCNWMGAMVCGCPDMTLREMWGFDNEKQKEKLYEKFGAAR